MFEFLRKLYHDEAFTLEQLEDAVLHYNAQATGNDRIRIVDLSEGAYVSRQKYMAKCRKMHDVHDDLKRKDKKCMEMRMRIIILEQRLKAYELMMTCNEKGMN